MGAKLEQTQLEALTAQLQLFQSHLSSFALHHRAAINANPILRYQFHSMCTSIGVDPLASHRSLLSSLLHLGDFYYTLALHLAEICLLTQPYNGGLISLPELLARLTRKVPGNPRLSAQDVLTALGKLECLGGGWGVVEVGGEGGGGRVGGKASKEVMVRSMVSELSVEEVDVLRWARGEGRGGVGWTVQGLEEGLRWERRRAEDVTRRLVGSGMVWVDMPGGGKEGEEEEPARYFFYSLFIEQQQQLQGSPSAADGEAGGGAAAAGVG